MTNFYVFLWNMHGHFMPFSKPCNSNLFTLQGDFIQKCRLIRERLDSRETETLGKWLTEDAMKRSGNYSAQSIKSITNYCRQFPESLCRTSMLKNDIYIYIILLYIRSGLIICQTILIGLMVNQSYIAHEIIYHYTLEALEELALQFIGDGILCHH